MSYICENVAWPANKLKISCGVMMIRSEKIALNLNASLASISVTRFRFRFRFRFREELAA